MYSASDISGTVPASQPFFCGARRIHAWMMSWNCSPSSHATHYTTTNQGFPPFFLFFRKKEIKNANIGRFAPFSCKKQNDFPTSAPFFMIIRMSLFSLCQPISELFRINPVSATKNCFSVGEECAMIRKTS